MKSVKRSSRTKKKTVAVVLFEREMNAVDMGKREDENLSEFIRAAIRWYVRERKEREGL